MKHVQFAVALVSLSAVGIPVVAAETEDYAGLPIYEENAATGPSEIVVNEQRLGYDGLPVTRLRVPAVQPLISGNRDGYDGLPLGTTRRSELSAIEAQ